MPVVQQLVYFSALHGRSRVTKGLRSEIVRVRRI